MSVEVKNDGRQILNSIRNKTIIDVTICIGFIYIGNYLKNLNHENYAYILFFLGIAILFRKKVRTIKQHESGDLNGLVHKEIIMNSGNYETKPYTGVVEAYHKNGRLYRRFHVLNGVRGGLTQQFDENRKSELVDEQQYVILPFGN